MIQLDIKKTLHGSSGEMELGVDLKINEGEFIALAGQSGSGKTTLLRIIAGLEKAEGVLRVGDEVWMDHKQTLPPQKRKIGFVFQDYALFPNMTVLENLLFVAKEMKLAEHLLEITGLSELRNRLPGTLSGGQQQRVSLCRAMMNRPKILLMDEPLSALDPQMRTKLQHEILTLHREFGTTTIMVSHEESKVLVIVKPKSSKTGSAGIEISASVTLGMGRMIRMITMAMTIAKPMSTLRDRSADTTQVPPLLRLGPAKTGP